MSDQPVAPSARDTSSKTSKAWRADASEPPKAAGTSRRNSPPSWSAATTGPARVTPSSLAEACPSSSGASSRATSSGPARSMQRSGSTETPGPAREAVDGQAQVHAQHGGEDQRAVALRGPPPGEPRDDVVDRLRQHRVEVVLVEAPALVELRQQHHRQERRRLPHEVEQHLVDA